MWRLQASVIFFCKTEIGELDHGILLEYEQMYKSAPKCNRVMEVSMIYRSRTEMYESQLAESLQEDKPILNRSNEVFKSCH